MKSRTSFFNQTVFRKNLTRFAPAWGLYTLAMILGLILIIDGGAANWFASDILQCAHFMSVVTPCYAVLVAQLLFGDLYNSRMCNSLHALPLRREEWFLTNVVSGFVFHLIPTAVMGLLATGFILLTGYYSGWVAGLLWFAGVNLQFVCFFGIAVFSSFCVGHRFAMAVVYGILNFGSLILGWVVDSLYTPMFYGVETNLELFFWFSPVAQMMEAPYMLAEKYNGGYLYVFELGENFWYYIICAIIGLALLVLALQLYRKRHLECAGDFMAVKVLDPVFQVVFTLVAGAVFQFVFGEMFGMDSLIFLFVGLAVGFFIGRMLLMRSVSVFQLRGWLGCGAVMAAFALTLVVASFDPFGIESWVPEADEVESVTISDGHYNYHESQITLESKEDIETILSLHREALENRGEDVVGIVYWEAEPMATAVPVEIETVEVAERQKVNAALDITLEYHLTDGRTVRRYYTYWSEEESGKILNSYFSSAECVFRMEADVDGLLLMYNDLTISPYVGDAITVDDRGDVRELLEAIVADCEAGTMSQDWEYRSWEATVCWLHFSGGLEIRVYPNCENTVQWLEENGVDVDAILVEHKRAYG